MRKNPVGIVRAALVAAVVTAVATVGFFALKSPSGSVLISRLGGSPKVSEEFFNYLEDPLVRKHYASQANIKAYRNREQSSAFETSTTTVAESVFTPGGDINVRRWEEVSGQRKKESINLGNTIYFKDDSDGVWWVQKLAPDIIEKQSITYDLKPYDPMVQPDLPRITHKSLGQEACGNLICHKYVESLPELSEAPRYIWFDTNQFLLRREEVGFGEFRIAIEYSYDNIKIQAPSPTKPVPEGRNIYDYMMEAELRGSKGIPSYKDWGIPEGGFTPEDFGSDPSPYE